MTCPTPWKISHPSRRAAITYSNNTRQPLKKQPGSGQTRPYKCPCGDWHLTSMHHKEGRAKRRIT